MRVQLRRGGRGAPLLILHGELGVPGWLRAYAQLAEQFTVYVPVAAGLRPLGAARLDRRRTRPRRVDHLVRPRSEAVPASARHRVLARRLDRRRDRHHERGALHEDGAGGGRGPAAGSGPGLGLLRPLQPEAFARAFYDGAKSPEYAQYYDRPWTAEEEAQAEQNREMAARLVWKPYMRSHTLAGLLGGIATPTLVVWGREDAIIPLEVMRPLRAGDSRGDGHGLGPLRSHARDGETRGVRARGARLPGAARLRQGS